MTSPGESSVPSGVPLSAPTSSKSQMPVLDPQADAPLSEPAMASTTTRPPSFTSGSYDEEVWGGEEGRL
jgi:hypothetical protein